MERFIGRTEELNALENEYQAPGFRMTVIYGRRRVGKSTLIREFIKGKRASYFTAVKNSGGKNISLWGHELLTAFAPPFSSVAFADIAAALEFLDNQSRTQRTVVVIDELPYLVDEAPQFLSMLQNYIDTHLSSGNLYLILCGSSVSFMEDEVLSEKSPLFGRRTSQLHIQPFNYLESSYFVPNYSEVDKAITFGVTGGVAKYLSLFDNSISLKENIIRLYFRKSGYLYEEASNLLTQEFSGTFVYSAVIEALASGLHRVNEICDRTHLNSPSVTQALAKLVAVGIAGKEAAITEENNKKKTWYILKDRMLQFWYRFIPEATTAIEFGKGDEYYNSEVEPLISDYMGDVFEEICRSYTIRRGLDSKLNCCITRVGKWWGTDPKTRQQTDIDIVGISQREKKAILGECKFRNEILDKSVYESLLSRTCLIDSNYQTVQYLLFSKSGFSDWVTQNTDPRVTKLVTMEELYKS